MNTFMNGETKNKVKEFKRKGGELAESVRKQVLTYIVAAFGLVAGLAWNEAIKALIEEIFPLGKDTLLAKFLYAILVTLIVVFITVYLVRFLKKEE